MIKVFCPANELELAMIKSLFEAEGIEYFVQNDHYGVLTGTPSVGSYAAAVPAQASLELGGLCALTICTVSALWYSLVALVFSLDRARKAFQRFRARIERAAGAVFVFLGVRLAVTD